MDWWDVVSPIHWDWSYILQGFTIDFLNKTNKWRFMRVKPHQDLNADFMGFHGDYRDSLRFSPRLSLHRGSFRGSWASWAASSVAPAASSSVASTWTNAKCGGPRMAGAPRDGTGLRWVFGGMDYGIVIHNLVSLPMEYWWNIDGILMEYWCYPFI